MNQSLFSLALKTLPEFLRWHFLQRPKEIMRTYAAYASAFASVFSFVYLLRTLFSPWKAIADAYPSKGFHVAEIGSVFALNMTARAIGAVIRLCTILIGLLFEALCLVFFAAYLAAWVLYPVLLIGSLYVVVLAFFG